jgi:diacylglycerol kinase (ATP)
MKKTPLPLIKRLQYSIDGIVAAWQAESSLRLEAGAVLLVVVMLAVLKADVAWWSIFALLAAGVLSAELVNTAIENMCDLFHPEVHSRIKVAKDCASAAVFVLNTAGILILLLFLFGR